MKLNIPTEFKSRETFGDWTLYHLPENATGSFLWQRFKFMRSPYARCRRGQIRAYRLAWNPLQCRFVRDRLSKHLQDTHPATYFDLECHMRLIYGQDWLDRYYEPYEIEAEQRRLKARRAQREAEERRTALLD